MSKKPSSASIAKDRLRIMLKSERGGERPEREMPRFLPNLSRELRDLVAKHVHVTSEDVRVTIEQVDGQEVLELCVRIPDDILELPAEPGKKTDAL